MTTTVPSSYLPDAINAQRVKVGQQDFAMLVQIAVRETCGTRSFRVQWVVDICTRFAFHLPSYTRAWISSYIRTQAKQTLGDHDDAAEWLKLADYLDSLKNVSVVLSQD